MLQRDNWTDEAARSMVRPELLETSRGRLLDRNGKVLAEDVACIDACVDFRALVDDPDPKWIADLALDRLRQRGDLRGVSNKTVRAQIITDEQQRVRTDIRILYQILARYGRKTPDEIDELRRSIVQKVDLRSRYIWYARYTDAVKSQPAPTTQPWYMRWLSDEASARDMDRYKIEVAEQTAAHPILRAIDPQTANALGKLTTRFTWLSLLPSVHRDYPCKDVAAQVIGRTALVTANDLKSDPEKDNPLRKYLANDVKGFNGLEALCEPALRGTRGRVEHYYGGETHELSTDQAVPGRDVTTTLDIDLQRQIQDAFVDLQVTYQKEPPTMLDWMPGAAVVLDVATNQVLAMVSYPTFDLNEFDEQYAELSKDTVNRPLMNRATQLAVEPGSSVKPMVGLAAIAEGVSALDRTIECTGMMMLNGRPQRDGRCWAYKMYGVTHHQTSGLVHPTGFLTFGDALERSCNIFFETTAQDLGMQRLSKWYDKFGLGRVSGVGISETRGRLPHAEFIPASFRTKATWFSGIGESQVLATPIQIANEAATVARNGIWMRPRLVPPQFPTSNPFAEGPDVVDLHLSAASVAEAKDGMLRVVNSLGGTGRLPPRPGFQLAGKTGTAQTGFFTITKNGEPLPGESVIKIGAAGREREMIKLVPGKHDQTNPRAPWYRYFGDKDDVLAHAWYIGFAPADHPKIAFAVLVEYGGSGGGMAGQVAERVLDALVKQGYLPAG